ncbi:TetR/AcrR family transcriptional regulator [Alloalcanivorax xenomutans]|jgi:AcrR family transcriptional regulator|uniref:TetR/AcrR family transcriptional regulator n=1 Tax=Alloalcanivorax xenomutans TaxID=1094342 RepID=A0A9Q3ZEW6_9GAMM|nr:TetR/AcrR family transcriptional regulator [Alloalcanivorax xenomutans]ERS14727.1 TetR family transcriptional regulator [Alcanivorax sp. PN-3]KYZ86537.1 TetR family transcriptional regulator [Alcanivorax sp. KX64203]MBA4720101.1 TetR/AcrR family transcriptional regulator [Alcanivorax sp.]ARB44452.1 TetR family transcriptional regulator [Alloalcanivorax xenomutans]MCE7511155.1 TetR/AcrR family transcriptional regulator [Alloalcanivorax xenomutans]
MPRTPRQPRAKATVNAIVEAGFLSLSEHGVQGTTTRHIADLAGVSVGSLYEYFANKEEVFEAMHHHMVAEVVAMVEPMTPALVRMEIRDLIKELLFGFRDLLEKNQGRYLRYMSYAAYFAPRNHMEPIQRLLMNLLLQYVIHHPQLARLGNLPAMGYIMINGGVFTVLRYLSEPNPTIGFEELVKGLGDMVAHFVEGELRKED